MGLMTLSAFKKLNLPDVPGVYFFTKNAKTLYIGRATSLRDRVGSYFKNDLIATRGPFLVDMVSQADTIRWEETGSVLEAIILESNLIKKHQPKYNTKEKDNRSYNYVVITDEEFPRVMLIRERVLEQASSHFEKLSLPQSGIVPHLPTFRKKFGPYPQGSLLKEALSIIRKIFPFRDAKAGTIPGVSHTERFYGSLGLSPDISSPDAKKEYAKTIRNVSLFLEGRKKDLTKALARDMKSYAHLRQFEKAEKVKRTLYALEHIQDVALIKKSMDGGVTGQNTGQNIRIEAYDIAHLGGSSTVGVMTVVEGNHANNFEPNKNEYRKFKLKTDANDDVGGLREILSRRFAHPEWPIPDLIVIDGGSAQKNAAEKMVSTIPVVSVVKDDRHRPKEILATGSIEKKFAAEYRSAILLANAEAHRFAIAYHRRRSRKKLLSQNML
jgi:excinuclease ABC subunit C